MTEECPVRGCAEDDCEGCYGTAWQECIYVVVYNNIRSGKFKNDRGTPWTPEKYSEFANNCEES